MKRVGKVLAALAALLVIAAAAAVVWWVREPLEVLATMRRMGMERAGFEADELEVEGGAVRVWSRGAGPTLVFVHGVGNDAGTWVAVAPALAEHYRVVVIDLPGHAGLAPQSGPLPMATVIAGAEAALAATSGKVTVVGNSLGGWLAFLLAERHPERVERIVAIGGGPLAGEAGGPSLVPKNREEAAALMARVRDASAPPLPGYMLDDLIERAGSGPIGRLSADVPGLVAALWNEDRLQTLATPVDLLWGASDRIVPLTYAERLESLLPVARLQVIPSCGHVPQLECPGTFLDQLRSVLSTAPAIPATIQTERSVESGGM
jgi:pimeloyl-ACP methyl ester carboxylesterase